MNEAETRAELIYPKLKEAGWGVIEGSKVLREYKITAGKIQVGGRGKKQIADCVLVYKGTKLAVVEAKSAALGKDISCFRSSRRLFRRLAGNLCLCSF